MQRNSEDRDGESSQASTTTTIFISECLCEIHDSSNRIRCGLFLTVLIAVTSVSATYLAQSTYYGEFNAPYFVTYFSTAWLILMYPIYTLILFIYSKGAYSPKHAIREHIQIFAIHEFTFGHFLGKSALFCVLWIGAMYTYTKALDPNFTNAADVYAIYSTHYSFFYILSWIVLFELFVAVRIIALIFSIIGVVLFLYTDSFGSRYMWGVILAVTSSAVMSIYKVLFKKFAGQPGFGKLSLFLSVLGLFSSLFLWPVLLVLVLSNTENISGKVVPWGRVCGTMILFLFYHLLMNYTSGLTYKVFLGLGVALGIPICTISDYVFKNLTLNGMEITALGLTFTGLLLVLWPERCPAGLYKPFKCCVKNEIEAQNREQRSHSVLHYNKD
ncbi:solute carrier family 35 member F3-like [Mytilus edulis]|uniref:SLC35F3_4 n=1 Tax=Mytilus edulis TaxID=6550 RepID=A0A8S3TTR9_MYTED|nr:SLC35F3_4 [Mytilus edulis]